MRVILYACLYLLLAASVAFAGPNAGVTLAIQGNVLGVETNGDPCGAIDIPEHCDDLNPSALPDSNGISWYLVVVVSPPGNTPNFNTVIFGLGVFNMADNYIGYTGACVPGALEIHTSGWPGPGEGTAVSWSPDCLYGYMEPVYYFGTYNYGGVIPLGPHPVGPSGVVDCTSDPREDSIQGFGEIEGENPACPSDPPDPSDATIVTWGDCTSGQCEIPDSNAICTTVAAGTKHSLALKSDGSIMAWGQNSYGECDVPAPNADFVAVAGGQNRSLGIKSDSTIVAWGDCGDCYVPLNAHYVAVAAGLDFFAPESQGHTLALKSYGPIVAWGTNDYGQCDVPEPNADFVAVAAGDNFSLGLKSDGSIAAWGRNYYHQCDVPEPNTDFVAMAAGYEHSLGLKSDGSIVAWGWDHYGQCNVPAPNADFVAVAGGRLQSLGLKSDGSIVAWGWNFYHQCDVPEPNADFVAMALGQLHSVGIKSLPVASAQDPQPVRNSKVPNIAIHSLAPNPFHRSVELALESRVSYPMMMTVHDLSGRLVRVIPLGALEPGLHRVRWDGCNGSGATVSDGMYWIRLNNAVETSEAVKVILIR
ncbi:MAG: hypothetical protein KJ970_12735 [Candidatus Eisenbacteria bacterium]|uniref:FlgD/Vpr Ig-like domain-containing protein n=1 Tax=Eiseniibacteriota bacterium TaxID=2212470 RepID=A0A948RY90_UNCEI|nr:hypothetical protein [Candidatus Eisenbacteria bacterium]MBU2691784.1 hypothetical protein [Candidatus Eisenbacteria bacterium]